MNTLKNHIGHIGNTPATTQGVSNYSSPHQVSKNDQEDFEKSLDETQWNDHNSDLFNKGITNMGFHQANATARHYSEEHKKTMDDLTDAGKSKSHHRQA